MRFFALWVALIGVLSGCADGISLFRPRHVQVKTQAASLKARFASKKIIAMVFEVGTGKSGRQEYAFNFEKSIAIDKALINLRFPVMDRSVIQSVLEAQKLPETGSFKQDDIARIAKQSSADIMIIGFVLSTPQPTMFNSEKRGSSAIMRAIDLKTFEVINSVQSDSAGPDIWRRLAPELMLLNEED